MIRGYAFIIFEFGRRISRMGFAFLVLLAAIFMFVFGRFLAVRLDWADANNVAESAVEWGSWPDLGWTVLPVFPIVLFAVLIAWGRYGSKTTYYDLNALQQRMYQQVWAQNGIPSIRRLMSLLTIFGWLVFPFIGLIALFQFVQSIFGT